MKNSFTSLRSRLASERGFGLVELIVVVAILGILVVIAIPIYGAIQDNALRTAAQEGANNMHNSYMATYASAGADAAARVVQEANLGNEPIVYYVVEGNQRDKGASDYRYRQTIEGNFKNSPQAFDTTSLRRSLAALPTPSVGNFKQSDGKEFCVVAYAGDPKVKFLAFAGEACGPPTP
jgi:prepilin-type N-terminal cleavage/methylation domain-containing protein